MVFTGKTKNLGVIGYPNKTFIIASYSKYSYTRSRY